MWFKQHFHMLYNLWKMITNISFTIKNHGFLEGQFDKNVHFDQKVCPLWLKVWGMKNICYILLVHLTKMTYLTKGQAQNLVKMNKTSIKMAMV
jgi:hypothetical protein